MSKRTDRRAAERAAHKTARAAHPLNPTAVQPTSQLVQAEQAYAAAACANSASRPLNLENLTDNDFENLTDAEMGILANEALAIREAPRRQAAAESTTSQAQVNANRENAKLSTGPTSAAGREKVSQNRRSHGLLGRFMLMPGENPADYEDLVQSVHEEYDPQSDTEFRLANSVVQHYWLMQRAIRLQEENFADEKKLGLYMRYQSAHERSYYKAQKELVNIQKQKRKEANGFESQNRQQEAHEARIRLTHANAQRMEIDSQCRQVMEAPIPGNTKIGFEQLTKACAEAVAALVFQNQLKTAE